MLNLLRNVVRSIGETVGFGLPMGGRSEAGLYEALKSDNSRLSVHFSTEIDGESFLVPATVGGNTRMTFAAGDGKFLRIVSSEDMWIRYDQPSYVGDAGPPVNATGTLTSTGAFGDGEIVTIDTKVYTFETALTNVDGNVLIGGSQTASHLNLLNAMNLSGDAGTDYALAMTAHPTVGGTSSDGTTTVVTAKGQGAADNAFVTSTNLANASWTQTGGTTLVDGVAGQGIFHSKNETSFIMIPDVSQALVLSILADSADGNCYVSIVG